MKINCISQKRCRQKVCLSFIHIFNSFYPLVLLQRDFLLRSLVPWCKYCCNERAYPGRSLCRQNLCPFSVEDSSCQGIWSMDRTQSRSIFWSGFVHASSFSVPFWGPLYIVQRLLNHCTSLHVLKSRPMTISKPIHNDWLLSFKAWRNLILD